MTSDGPGVTAALLRLREGDRSAFHELAPLVYDELRLLAQRQMNGQSAAHTLQATALLNAAFERLLRHENPDWNDRSHFVSAAVCAMRCVLVDHARRKSRVRRSAPGERVPLDELVDQIEARSMSLLTLEDTLRRMEERDPRMARIVEHATFGGLTVAEIAAAMGVSRRTVERELAFARAWMLKDRR